jgi:hypothetical protein
MLEATTPHVDVAAIVAALPAPRLRVVATDRTAVRAKPRRAPWATRSYLAAAASLLIVASLASPYLMRQGKGPVGAGVPDSSVAALPITPEGSTTPSTTPGTIPGAASAASVALAVDGGLSDISDDDLRTLLAELESLEATIAVEPATVRAPIVSGPGTL